MVEKSLNSVVAKTGRRLEQLQDVKLRSNVISWVLRELMGRWCFEAPYGGELRAPGFTYWQTDRHIPIP
jgi:hypothetical protein